MTRHSEDSVQRKHLEAMAFCDKAVVARAKGNHARAKRLFRVAFELERDAAYALEQYKPNLEPSRSVLFRSAASLALECGEHRSAEQLIAEGLTGNPADEIAEELRDLYEQVNLERHLSLRGLKLADAEFQLSLEGNGTGFGMAQSDQVVSRVEVSSKLMIRSIERKLGMPFREYRRPSQDIRDSVELYPSAPRPASFALTIRLGVPEHTRQLRLPFPGQEILYKPQEVIDDVFACLESLSSDSGDIEQLIPDDTYRRNFRALAKKLGPDGDRVKMVGLTAIRDGNERKVVLRKPVGRPEPDSQRGEVSHVFGRLKVANEHSQKNSISIIEKTNRARRIVVPSGMMLDIVRDHWGDEVVATVHSSGKSLILDELESYSKETADADSEH